MLVFPLVVSSGFSTRMHIRSGTHSWFLGSWRAIVAGKGLRLLSRSSCPASYRVHHLPCQPVLAASNFIFRVSNSPRARLVGVAILRPKTERARIHLTPPAHVDVDQGIAPMIAESRIDRASGKPL